MQVEEIIEFLSMVTCQVCEEFMTSDISQCPNEHSICLKCKTTLGNCPLCPEKFTNKRNLTSEMRSQDPQLLPDYDFKRRRIASPTLATPYQNNAFVCPFNQAQKVCKFCSNISELKIHLKNNHKAFTMEQQFEEFVKFKMPLGPCDRWDRVVIAFEEIFHCNFVTKQSEIFLFVRYIGPVEKASLYVARLLSDIDRNTVFETNVLDLEIPEESILGSVFCYHAAFNFEVRYKKGNKPIYFSVQIMKSVSPPLPKEPIYPSPSSIPQLSMPAVLLPSTEEDRGTNIMDSQNSGTAASEADTQIWNGSELHSTATTLQLCKAQTEHTVSTNTGVVEQDYGFQQFQENLPAVAGQTYQPDQISVQDSVVSSFDIQQNKQTSAEKCSSEATETYQLKSKHSVGAAVTHESDQNKTQNSILLNPQLPITVDEKEDYAPYLFSSTSTAAEHQQYENKMQNRAMLNPQHVLTTEAEKQRFVPYELNNTLSTATGQTFQLHQEELQDPSTVHQQHVPITEVEEKRYNYRPLTVLEQTRQPDTNQIKNIGMLYQHVSINKVKRKSVVPNNFYNRTSGLVGDQHLPFQNQVQNPAMLGSQAAFLNGVEQKRSVPNQLKRRPSTASGQIFQPYQNQEYNPAMYSHLLNTEVSNDFNSRPSTASGQSNQQYQNQMQNSAILSQHVPITEKEKRTYAPNRFINRPLTAFEQMHEPYENQIQNPAMVFAQHVPINGRSSVVTGQTHFSHKNQMQNPAMLYPQHIPIAEIQKQTNVPIQFSSRPTPITGETQHLYQNHMQNPVILYPQATPINDSDRSRQVPNQLNSRPSAVTGQTYKFYQNQMMQNPTILYPQATPINDTDRSRQVPNQLNNRPSAVSGQAYQFYQNQMQNPVKLYSQATPMYDTERPRQVLNQLNNSSSAATGHAYQFYQNQIQNPAVLFPQATPISGIERQRQVHNQMNNRPSAITGQAYQFYRNHIQNPTMLYAQPIPIAPTEKQRHVPNQFNSRPSAIVGQTPQIYENQIQNPAMLYPQPEPIIATEKQRHVPNQFNSIPSVIAGQTPHPYQNQIQDPVMLHPPYIPITQIQKQSNVPNQFNRRPLRVTGQIHQAYQSQNKNSATLYSQPLPAIETENQRQYVDNQFNSGLPPVAGQTHQAYHSQNQNFATLYSQQAPVTETENQTQYVDYQFNSGSSSVAGRINQLYSNQVQNPALLRSQQGCNTRGENIKYVSNQSRSNPSTGVRKTYQPGEHHTHNLTLRWSLQVPPTAPQQDSVAEMGVPDHLNASSSTVAGEFGLSFQNVLENPDMLHKEK